MCVSHWFTVNTYVSEPYFRNLVLSPQLCTLGKEKEVQHFKYRVFVNCHVHLVPFPSHKKKMMIQRDWLESNMKSIEAYGNKEEK